MPNDDNYWRHTMVGGSGRPGAPAPEPGSGSGNAFTPSEPPAAAAHFGAVAPTGPAATPDEAVAPTPSEPAASAGHVDGETAEVQPFGTEMDLQQVEAPQSEMTPQPAETPAAEVPQPAKTPVETLQPEEAPQPAQPLQPAQPAQPAQAPAQPAQASAHPVPPSAYAAPSGAQPSYGTADTPAPKSHWWIVAIVIVVALAGTILYSVSTCTSMLGTLPGRTASSSLDGLTRDTVGIITISGTIQYDNTACSPEGLKQLLDRAEKNDHIKAVVLRIDSGGGTATAGEEMAEYVRQFSKPVVVSSASINASAAYEISSQADYIFVAKSTEIGAIGTAMELADLSGLLDKLGVNMETITSAESKDSSYGYRELTDEERAYYQEMVDQINEVFVQNVADGRKMDIEAVRKLATGMPFTGLAAVDNGLADQVGTREDAVNKAAELGGISGTVEPVYIDLDTYYDLDSLYTLLGSSRVGADDLLAALDAAGTGAHLK